MRQVELDIESWSLLEPFVITDHTWTHCDVLVASITENEVTGRGEATGVYYLDETAESICHQALGIQQQLEQGASVWHEVAALAAKAEDPSHRTQPKQQGIVCSNDQLWMPGRRGNLLEQRERIVMGPGDEGDAKGDADAQAVQHGVRSPQCLGAFQEHRRPCRPNGLVVLLGPAG